jgi:hypothetical protein
MAVCARCSAPLVATARFCAACGSPVLLNTTPRPESRAVEPRPDSRGPTAAVPAVPAAPGQAGPVPDPYARTVMGDADAAAAFAAVRAATSEGRIATAPLAAVGAVAAARPNPVSPMASSVMNTPGDPPARQKTAATPWNVAAAPAQVPSPSPAPYTPMAPTAPAPYPPGSMVLVHWSNGQRYPGTVLQVAGTQVLVTFPNGQQHWVDMQYVSKGS